MLFFIKFKVEIYINRSTSKSNRQNYCKHKRLQPYLTMETTVKPIPAKTRKEWIDLLNGDINHSFRNYVLQMRVHQAQKEMKEGKITQKAAIDSLYTLCEKYALACQNDFITIFKTW